MLDNGTVMNGKLIESPKSFQVACTVMTQVIAAVASSQYGGQSVDIRHLGKYLRKSYNKFYKALSSKYNGTVADETLKSMAMDRLKDELKSGVQTIQYQINTLMTTNGQSPFVTIFLYLDKDDEYLEENAMIIEEILRQRYEGIKNEKGVYVTPAFPKLIYVLDEHNCLKGGKYDYIILDGPPVGLVSDSLIISRVADIVAYVVRLDYTHKADARFIMSLVAEKKLENLSIVVNAEDLKKKNYGSYYGSHYGSYYGSGRYSSYGYTENE
jgi:hypothetical protein